MKHEWRQDQPVELLERDGVLGMYESHVCVARPYSTAQIHTAVRQHTAEALHFFYFAFFSIFAAAAAAVVVVPTPLMMILMQEKRFQFMYIVLFLYEQAGTKALTFLTHTYYTQHSLTLEHNLKVIFTE